MESPPDNMDDDYDIPRCHNIDDVNRVLQRFPALCRISIEGGGWTSQAQCGYCRWTLEHITESTHLCKVKRTSIELL